MSHARRSGLGRLPGSWCLPHERARVYELDPEDGHSIVMVDPVPPELEVAAQLGVDSCPERAISVLKRRARALVEPLVRLQVRSW